MLRCCSVLVCLALCVAASAVVSAAKPGGGKLTLTFVDQASGKAVPCRVHLKNQFGVVQKALKMPFWHDHFASDGQLVLELPKGNYTFVVERGPEYAESSGHFMMVDHGEDQKTIELKRACHMAAEHWWSGDLHVERPLRDMQQLMLAEDLHVASVVTWSNKKSEWTNTKPPTPSIVRFGIDRCYDTLAGKDERGGGSLLYMKLPRPLAWLDFQREYPASIDVLRQSRAAAPSAWVAAEKPTAWDFPVWVAHGELNSIHIAHSHFLRTGMAKNEASGRPRDKQRFPDPLGHGESTQDVYYQVLNCGLRIPPTAGSGSGVSNNPVGYNRVYAHVDTDELTPDAWWDAVRQGRVVVTNGPLIRPLANGQLPGHAFYLAEGEELDIDVAMNLTTRDRIEYLEIVQDGRVARSVRLDEWARTGHFPPLKVKQSGWFLVRVVTKTADTYRFASSGPWYVSISGQPPRVSKRSAQFFLDWVNDRIGQLPLTDPAERAQVISSLESAKQYWARLVEQANAP